MRTFTPRDTAMSRSWRHTSAATRGRNTLRWRREPVSIRDSSSRFSSTPCIPSAFWITICAKRARCLSSLAISGSASSCPAPRTDEMRFFSSWITMRLKPRSR